MLEIMRENASGWVVKVIFAILIVVFVFAFGMSGMDTGNDPVLATVNDQIITRAEFEDAFQRAAEGMRKSNPSVTSAQLQTPQFKQMVLGELINSRLLLDEASRLGISASKKEVFAAITRQSIFWNQQGQFDRNIYQMALRSIRMTPPQFEANFRNEYISDKVKNMVRQTGVVTPEQARQIYDWVGEQITIDYIQKTPADFMKRVNVTEDEVEKFYTANEEKFMVPEQVRLRYLSFTPSDLAAYQTVSDEEIKAYYDANADSMIQKEQVKARHILILSKEDDPENVQKEARNKINRIYKKAKAGSDFGKLAQKYSEGPSAPRGGELGWFGRGDMVPEFETAAFTTPKGSFSQPIRTQFGWHIILVEDHKKAETKTLEQVKDEISNTLAEEKASEKVTDMLDQSMDRLVSGMKLEDVADELGMLAVTSRPIPEKFLPQAFGMTPEAAKVVMSIPVGEAHQTPLAIDGGYMLVEKAEDIPAAPMELEQVKPVIINNIKKDKATELAQKAAEDILAELAASPEAARKYKGQIKTTTPFDRKGTVAELGQNENMATAAFAARDNAWLDQPYVMPSGIIVARVAKRIPAPEAAWEAQKDAWMQQASQNYENEVLNAFMTGLREKAQIEIARPDLLN
ncbi:SurA N-terminal domain-containing protein [Pseudodesulfovibrio piezophilus]|uniref:Periplasmic chaperone PpiD n=1 Tax=Pseudodesulfovibrio piezophilus (strain DSM 21447 / JCM 15486 / C1TLV30) TaxID=1322246 RepID=M1WST3_PSEP2|nr:SurA N-terminal domain-containing protein [Pseudodesulfovibrio piezophilus]CCH49087.1 PpiC-type peptidyl-prolyl cis-trans isomerase [Pseudodesulfovibrio piezophilus C1TLV30]